MIKRWAIFGFVGLLVGVLVYWGSHREVMVSRITRTVDLQEAFKPFNHPNELPSTVERPEIGQTLQVNWAIDKELQSTADRLLGRFKPDHGAILVMDADTGEILVVSHRTKHPEIQNLALHHQMPSASLFKVITAAAAIDIGALGAETPISFYGGLHTLYRRNLRRTVSSWANRLTVGEALAKSANTVFGKIGVFHVGLTDLLRVAHQAGFGQLIPLEVPVGPSVINVPQSDFEIAELASGFGQHAKVSPVHAAWIAAAIVADGQAVAPRLIRDLKDSEGNTWRTKESPPMHFLSQADARELAGMMEETMTVGTARRTFAGFRRSPLGQQVYRVGGKTGNLTGHFPKGRHDWFMSFVEYRETDRKTRRLAITTLTINEEKWTVKSTYLARQMMEAAIRQSMQHRAPS